MLRATFAMNEKLGGGTKKNRADLGLGHEYASQVPRPTFGSGSGLQCVYTVVISL